MAAVAKGVTDRKQELSRNDMPRNRGGGRRQIFLKRRSLCFVKRTTVDKFFSSEPIDDNGNNKKKKKKKKNPIVSGSNVNLTLRGEAGVGG